MNQQAFSLLPFKLQQIQDLGLNLKIIGNIARNRNKLVINYQVIGDIAEVIIPQGNNLPIRQNELWEETCFELFLGIKDSPGYWEFNLSPNGNWNIYRFDDYRQGMREENTIKFLPFRFDQKADTLLLTLEFDLESLISINDLLDVSITSVIKFKDETLSYWAISHSAQVADFHQRDSFAIQL
ncbi:DOMON-like domain-containing protein [Calothrix sp. PCC 6303]|uniref:DOMON-like domain-containing protein n=1 Tax=Calothrix sp. PCC 6303 TaxID=1170562 RepID=UPI0002A0445A|nr:DOMON-like domain-containing protein [Calothrix sp. PCC 6303]AFZ00040.1 protein of unknown function DUF1567 [Calothrix sp. PCC 6303]